MNINIVYYIEVNLICITLLLFFMKQLKKSTKKTGNRIFSLLIWSTIVLCVSDVFAEMLKGQMFPFARVLNHAVNIVNFESLSIISFLWMIYVFSKFEMMKNFKKNILLWLSPLLLFTIAAVTNPVTHFLFTIDENNLYHRGFAIAIHWVISWMYLIIPTVKLITVIVHEKNTNKRKELSPFLFFIIAPSITSIMQMMFYGVTSTQVGITLSIVLVFISEQSNKISLDSLTKLSNRHALDEYISRQMLRNADAKLALLLIDINNFKRINDKYGHFEGDCALCKMAEVLREIMYSTQKKLFVCRYGGDEFLVAAFDCDYEEMNSIKTAINKDLEKINQKQDLMYDLSASIGLAYGKILNNNDINNLLKMADKTMYYEKKRFKLSNNICN